MLCSRLAVAAAVVLAAAVSPAVAAHPHDHGPRAIPFSGEAAVQGAPSPATPQGTPGVYPVLHAPLYPAPVQHVPDWSGGTIITNQALAPHEMLYPHKYHAMYPPFYYRVQGSWFVTPFGVRQHEKWTLQGTEVKVRYSSHYPLLSGFHPPR